MTVEEQLTDLQRRVKLLTANRDNIIREIGTQTQKLKEANQKLSDLGIKNPENMSDEELEQLALDLQSKLIAAIAELTAVLAEGEKLLAK
jgi:uncharacterized protein YwgA